MVTKSHVATFFAAVGFSFILIHSTFLKNSGIPSWEQSFFRLILSIPILFIVFKGKDLEIGKNDVKYFISAGLVFSLFLLFSLSALVFGASIVVTVSLIYTQPIFTAIISQVMKKEKMSFGKILKIIVGIIGAFLVTGLTISDILSLKINVGIFFALADGFLFALYLFLKRNGKDRGYSSSKITFNTFLFSVPVVVLFGLILRNFSTNPLFIGFVVPNLYQWILLLSFAIFSTILPYALLNFVNPKEISPTTEGLLLLLDPILHSTWAFLIFGQIVSATQYIGMALIIAVAISNFL